VTTPTALLVTTVHWPSTTRLALALARAGFKVAAITPAGHTVGQLSVLARHYVCHRYGQTAKRLGRAVTRAIHDVAPSIVIPCDDAAIDCLHVLYAAALGVDPASQTVALFRRSLGTPASLPVVARKADFMRFAEANGLAIPTTKVFRDPLELRRQPIGPLPQVIKIDGTSGGAGVWIVRTAEAWDNVVDRLAARPSWLQSIKRVVRSGNTLALRQRFGEASPPVLVQEYIAGEQANCTVAALDGDMLACQSARVVQTFSETGPATVCWIGPCRDIEDIAASIVRRLGFSGFCGFDFILRKDNALPVLIEMNARPTQACHLAFEPGNSLADVLFDAVRGQKRRLRATNTPARLVALFPQEFWRDPRSPYLVEAYHDVPWDTPYLVTVYRRPPPIDWVERIKRLIRSINRPRDIAAQLDIPLPKARGE
jgi:glutathione synthase/RimK-type ligase-like ATP-grasp enzyme